MPSSSLFPVILSHTTHSNASGTVVLGGLWLTWQMCCGAELWQYIPNWLHVETCRLFPSALLHPINHRCNLRQISLMKIKKAMAFHHYVHSYNHYIIIITTGIIYFNEWWVLFRINFDKIQQLLNMKGNKSIFSTAPPVVLCLFLLLPDSAKKKKSSSSLSFHT